MKILKMMSGIEFLLEDVEAENIARIFGQQKLVKLRSGEYVNTASIEVIKDIDTVPYWDGYMLEPDGRSFIRDGVKVKMETDTFSEIEYKPHPKYLAMKKQLDKKLSMPKAR